MREIGALLTDLDGTLVHSVDPICSALHQCFLHVGVTPPKKQQIIDMFGLPVEVMLITLTEAEEDDRQLIDEFIAEYKRQYPVHMAREARLIEGALETMRAFYEKGVKICLITSERRKNARFILDALGLSQYIKYLVSRDDVVHFKPDPEPLLRAAAMMREEKKDCAYVGESPFDIEAGVASGIYTVGVPSGNWPAGVLIERRPDRMIGDIRELKEIFTPKKGASHGQ